MTKGVKTVRVECSDGEKFVVPRHFVKQSRRLRTLLQTMKEDEGIRKTTKEQGKPILEIAFKDIDSATFSKVLEWCSHHKRDPTAIKDPSPETLRGEEIPAWDLDFLGDDQVVLYNLVMAADKLELTSLLNLCCKRIALLLKGKSVEEIRTIFNIKSDFTPEEEDQIAREEHWLKE